MIKYIHELITVSCLLLLSISCQPPQDISPTIDAELKPYYDSFIAEAKSHGYSSDFLKNNATIQLGKAPSPYAGITYYQSNSIVIDSVYWRNYKNYESRREFVMFHELAHLLLKREHDFGLLPNGEFKSIMFSYDNNPSPNTIYNWGIRRKYYIDELFNSNTASPEWSKKEYDPFPLASSNRQLVAAQEFSQSTALTNYLKTMPNAQCQIVENNNILNVKMSKGLGFFLENSQILAMAGINQDKIDLIKKNSNYEIEIRYRLKSGEILFDNYNENDMSAIDDFKVYQSENGKVKMIASVFFNLFFPEPPISLKTDFNVLRFVRQNGYFAFYLNDKLIHYSDALRADLPNSVRYAIAGIDNTEFDLDYFRIYQR
jgi:hypothetical protein